MRMAMQQVGPAAPESARAPLPGKARTSPAHDALDRDADRSVDAAAPDKMINAAGGSSRAARNHHYFQPRPAGRLPGFMQAKLKVGAVNDPLEQEADRVADQVMRMPGPEIAPASAPLQISRKCAACEADEEKLHRKEAATAQAVPGEAPASVHEVLRSPGQPLNAATRAYFEPRFGRDLGGVRVHNDDLAMRSARDVAARAYAVGQNIVFGDKWSVADRSLLAHELVHTIQQTRAAPGGTLRRAPVAPPPVLKPLGQVALDIAEVVLGPATDNFFAEYGSREGIYRGPVLAVVRDDLGRIYVAFNEGVPPYLTTDLGRVIAEHNAQIDAREVTLTNTSPKAIAGGHAEVRAMNAAIAVRERELNRVIPEAERGVYFEMEQIWLSGEGRVLTTAARCQHCRVYTRSIAVTPGVFHAEGAPAPGTAARGSVTRAGGQVAEWNTATGARTVSGQSPGSVFARERPIIETEPSIIVADPALRGQVTKGTETTYFKSGTGTASSVIELPVSLGKRVVGVLRSVALDLVVTLIIAEALHLAWAWLTYEKNVESKEERKLRELFEKNITPAVTKALKDHEREAVQMTTNSPEFPVYANVTVDLDETWIIAGATTDRSISDASFVDLGVSFKKVSRERTIGSKCEGFPSSQVKTCYATKRLTYSVEVDFGETEAEHQQRKLLHQASQAVKRGLSARSYGESTNWAGKDLTSGERKQDEERRKFGFWTLEEQRAYDERELWVLAYIEYTSFYGPDDQYADAKRYLEEIQRRPRPIPGESPRLQQRR